MINWNPIKTMVFFMAIIGIGIKIYDFFGSLWAVVYGASVVVAGLANDLHNK